MRRPKSKVGPVFARVYKPKTANMRQGGNGDPKKNPVSGGVTLRLSNQS